jgi:hypothetical protein
MEGSVSVFAIAVALFAVYGDVIKGTGSSSHYIVKESELNNLMLSNNNSLWPPPPRPFGAFEKIWFSCLFSEGGQARQSALYTRVVY